MSSLIDNKEPVYIGFMAVDILMCDYANLIRTCIHMGYRVSVF